MTIIIEVIILEFVVKFAGAGHINGFIFTIQILKILATAVKVEKMNAFMVH